MSSQRRDTGKDPAPNRDLIYSCEEDEELELRREFQVDSSTQAEVHSPVAIPWPGNLFGDSSDPNEPNMVHEASMMHEATTFSRHDFFPPYAQQPQPHPYQEHIRTPFPHHAGEPPTPPSPPRHGFAASGQPPEPYHGPGGYMHDGMHGSYVPHSSSEHFNYLRSFQSFDAPALQFEDRDVSHNQGVVSEVYPYDRFPFHVLHANGHGFHFPQEDESMDHKPAAIDRHASPYMQTYPQHAPTLPTYPTQDANVNDLHYPQYARAFKDSSPESASSSTYHSREQQSLKPPPGAAATAAAAAAQPLRRTSRRTHSGRSHSTGKHGAPVKESPKRGGRTLSKASRRAAPRATGRSPAYSSPFGPPYVDSTVHTSPTPQELAEARTPRKQEALRNWHQRLNDLRDFKAMHGHSTCTLVVVRGLDALFRAHNLQLCILIIHHVIVAYFDSQRPAAVPRESFPRRVGEQAADGKEGLRPGREDRHHREEDIVAGTGRLRLGQTEGSGRLGGEIPRVAIVPAKIWTLYVSSPSCSPPT
jgi:hypothetical protein